MRLRTEKPLWIAFGRGFDSPRLHPSLTEPSDESEGCPPKLWQKRVCSYIMNRRSVSYGWQAINAKEGWSLPISTRRVELPASHATQDVDGWQAIWAACPPKH